MCCRLIIRKQDRHTCQLLSSCTSSMCIFSALFKLVLYGNSIHGDLGCRQDVKELKVRPGTDVHDYEVRLRAAQKFLAKVWHSVAMLMLACLPDVCCLARDGTLSVPCLAQTSRNCQKTRTRLRLSTSHSSIEVLICAGRQSQILSAV